MDTELYAKMITEQFGLTSNEINTQVSKIVSDLSGLIDKEGGMVILFNELKRKSQELERKDQNVSITLSKPIIPPKKSDFVSIDHTELILLDIDNDIEIVVEHLHTHKNVLVRKSTNGNLHVITTELCPICDKYNDDRYEGKILFNNKGNQWAEFEWKNLKTNAIVHIPSENVVHLIIRMRECDENGKQIIRHIYGDIWYLSQHFDDIVPDPAIIEQDIEIYYTFHSVVTNINDRTWETLDQSGDKDKRLGQLIDEYQFKPFSQFSQLFEDYMIFITHLPQEIIND